MVAGYHDPTEEFIVTMNSSVGSVCPFSPDITLDPLEHHAVSCRHGGDVMIRHNHLRNGVLSLSVRVEAGRGLL